jgi:Putative adhesin
MKSALRLAALSAYALAGAACTVSVDSHTQIAREEKRFSVAGQPDVRLTTFDGAIEVRSWDRPEVLVEIEKRGPTRESIDRLEIVSAQKEDVIELEVKRPRKEAFSNVGFSRSPSARLVVFVPQRADVRARTSDGAIRLAGVQGRLELRTGDGSIRVSDASGELTFDTGDGSVTVEDAKGRLAIESGDGGVSVSGTFAAVRLRTQDGSIVYRAQPGTEMADDWEISTGDGSVSLYLPEGLSAEVDAQTGDGAIRNELRISGGGDDATRQRLRGRLGAAGGRLIRIRTGDGGIRLRPY